MFSGRKKNLPALFLGGPTNVNLDLEKVSTWKVVMAIIFFWSLLVELDSGFFLFIVLSHLLVTH